MINLVTAIYIVLYCNYVVGRFIVTCLGNILKLTYNLTTTVIDVVEILQEDFIYFLSDIEEKFTLTSRICSIIGSTFSTIIINGIHGIILFLWFVWLVFFTIIANSTIQFINIVILLKRLLVLLGAGIWFIITAIPISFVYGTTALLYGFGLLINELITMLKVKTFFISKVVIILYEFVADVPAQSVAGLLSLLFVIFVLYQFNVNLQFITNRTEQIIRVPYLVLYRSINRLRQCLPPIKQYSTHNISNNDLGNDTGKECVICQERLKCILALPCRHVCMCEECSITLDSYNNNCPICRCPIDISMMVYV